MNEKHGLERGGKRGPRRETEKIKKGEGREGSWREQKRE